MKDSPATSHIISPTSCFGKDDYQNVTVQIDSDFDVRRLRADRAKVERNKVNVDREQMERWLQSIPVLGRFAAHDTVNYWVSWFFVCLFVRLFERPPGGLCVASLADLCVCSLFITRVGPTGSDRHWKS
jgi:hypothetical protein